MDEAHAKEPGQHKVQNNQTTTGADLSTSTTDVPTPSSVDGLQQHVTAQNADQYFSGIGFSKDDQNGTNDDSSMQKNADSYQFNLTSPNIASNGDANQNPKPFTAESTKYGLDNITFDFNHAFSLHGSVFLGTQAGADGIGLMFQGLNQAGPGGQGSSFGLDSVNNGFGFKFDTYVNGQGYKQDGSPEQTGAFGPDPAGLNHPFGAFYYANKNWLPHPGQVTTIDQGLQTQQDIGNPDGQFHAIDFSFDGTEFVMLGFNHKWTITKQQLADLGIDFSQQFQFAISGGTGGDSNLQKFRLYDFAIQGQANVNVKYQDANGNAITGANNEALTETTLTNLGTTYKPTNLANLQASGWELVANGMSSYDAVNHTFDKDGSFDINQMDNNVTYTLQHKVIDQAPISKTFTRTINYLDGDKQLGTNVQKVTATEVPVKDAVTNQIIGYRVGSQIVTDANQAWVPNNDGALFTDVLSPDMLKMGYTQPSVSDVAAQDMATIVATSDPNGNQIVNVSYGHLQISKTITKEITRTINYLDGNKTVAPSVVQSVIASQTAVYDAVNNSLVGYQVNGKVIKDVNASWTIDPAANTWAAVKSPDLTSKGYYVASGDVAQSVVTGTTANQVINIDYGHNTRTIVSTKDETLTINYLDSVTGVSVAPSVTKVVSFKQTAIVDDVSGETLSYDTLGNGQVNSINATTSWLPVTVLDQSVTSPDLSKQDYTTGTKQITWQQVFADGGTVTIAYQKNTPVVNPASGKEPTKTTPSNTSEPTQPNNSAGTNQISGATSDKNDAPAKTNSQSATASQTSSKTPSTKQPTGSASKVSSSNNDTVTVSSVIVPKVASASGREPLSNAHQQPVTTAQLPKTDEKSSGWLSIIGVITLVFTLGIGVNVKRRQK